MLCPNCYSVMRSESEIHNILYGQRMDLHCWSRGEPKEYPWGKITCRPCHMGVLIHPNQEWICDHYNFSFKYWNDFYILRATPSTPCLRIVDGKAQMVYNKHWKYTEILKSYDQKPIIQMPFISLSTGDDMHLHAKYVFDRLMRLVVFS